MAIHAFFTDPAKVMLLKLRVSFCHRDPSAKISRQDYELKIDEESKAKLITILLEIHEKLDKKMICNTILSNYVVIKITKEGSKNTKEFVFFREEFYLNTFKEQATITLNGKLVYAFDDLNSLYHIEICERYDERQIHSLIDNVEENAFMNVLINNSGAYTSYRVESLSEAFSSISSTSVIKYYHSEESSETVLYDKLLENRILSVSDQSYPLKNHMYFEIVAEGAAESLDEALPVSFNAQLRSSGEVERKRLENYILFVSKANAILNAYFYAPVVNVCQSSGSGKSKLAKELMNSFPSAYVVIRESADPHAYPSLGILGKYFKNSHLMKNVNSSSMDKLEVYYMLLMKEIFLEYDSRLELRKNNNAQRSFQDFINSTNEEFIEGKFDLEKTPEILAYETNEFFTLPKMNSSALKTQLTDSITEIIGKILEKTANHFGQGRPFVFILDEASLMTSPILKCGSTLFRCFRRAIHRISTSSSKIVVVTLGTNSNVLDLNAELSADSLRYADTNLKLFKPFIINRNWDIFEDIAEMRENRLKYDWLLCGRMCVLHCSMGRPIFASISLVKVHTLALTKLKNNSIEDGTSFLACWMIRSSLSIHPNTVICSHLIQSLMARVLYISDDLKEMRIKYPSEPILAFAARAISEEFPYEYYKNLEIFLNSRVADSARIAEAISCDIILKAVTFSERVIAKTWKYLEGLPKICKKSYCILNEQEETLLGDSILADTFYNFDYSVTVEKLIEAKFRVDSLKKYIPEIFCSALVNVSHFTNMTRSFPHEDLAGSEEPETLKIVADPNYPFTTSNPCNMINDVLLEIGLRRTCGHVMPPGYFGLDSLIPAIFDPDIVSAKSEITESNEIDDVDEKYEKDTISDKRTRVGEPESVSMLVSESVSAAEVKIVSAPKPEFSIRSDPPTYSYIGVQVKKVEKGSGIREIVAKCAVSNHYIRCIKHQACSNSCPLNCSVHVDRCNDSNCDDRIKDEQYAKIIGNGFAFIHILNDDMSRRASNRRNLQRTTLEVSAGMSNEPLNELCPAAILNDISNIQKSSLKKRKFSEGRFIPDVYVRINVAPNLYVHFMAKKYASSGLIERLTVIESRGFRVFKVFLNDEVAKIACRIVHNDIPIFTGVDMTKTVKYKELLNAITHTNGEANILSINNYYRSRVGADLVPEDVPDYVPRSNNQGHLSSTQEQNLWKEYEKIL